MLFCHVTDVSSGFSGGIGRGAGVGRDLGVGVGLTLGIAVLGMSLREEDAGANRWADANGIPQTPSSTR